MKKSILIGMTAVALTLGACGRKTPPAEVPPVEQPPATDPNSTDPNSLEVVELPALQADLVAKAGSDTIYFGTDEYSLDDASKATLAAQAQWMLANPNVRASIEGHADERGTREYNQALGERRANAARDFLLSQGVPAARLVVTSWGKERPVALGSNEEAWAQNRRAVTVIIR
ncbi:peptidoglycan-associated lipoprotein Pal [Sphingomonas edaphi]|uniref:peptidoglycan-associated lipoprotein Pal n=1 Tax=Sphingomonas edaphi TaxID=2315689 RepID=UPI0018F290CB|nr:peptidoglycan-associated lipoprotein Pal [Sphingomonas edaphi]